MTKRCKQNLQRLKKYLFCIRNLLKLTSLLLLLSIDSITRICIDQIIVQCDLICANLSVSNVISISK